MNTSLTFAGLVTVLTITVGGCGRHEESYETAPTPVRVQTVGLSTMSDGTRYSATITPYEQVDLQFKVGGYIREILQTRGVDGSPRAIQQGDTVTKGMVLARVREDDYVERVKHAKAQLTRAEVSVQKAQQDWNRASHLFSMQSLTKPDYDSAKAQLDSAQASVAGAHSQLAEAQLSLQDSILTAPMDGVLLQRKIEVGTLATPGTIAFVLGNLSVVKVIFGVPDSLLTQLKIGAPLTITTESLRGTEFAGRVTAISPAADTRSRVFNVEVTVPNPKYVLKAGMIASLEVSAGKPQQPVTVMPISAIIRACTQSDQYAVFVVEENNDKQIARSRVVKLGEVLGNTIEVLEGVSVGEHVITTGATLVSEGEMVRIMP